MTDTPAPDERLYGEPGAEILETELEDAAGYAYDHLTGETFRIEEWTVRPPTDHLPAADRLLEALEEWAFDNEVDTDGDHWIHVTPELIAQAQALLDAVAASVTWRQAGRHVADHLFHVDDDGPTHIGRIPIEPGGAR